MENDIKLHFVVDMDEETANFSPHLGIGYLSAYLKHNIPGIKISLSLMTDDVFDDIHKINPDIIGLSCTSRYFLYFTDLAQDFRVQFNVPILWGGVHISIAPNELPISSCVGVLGEGELTVLELLNNFNGKEFENLHSIKGIVFRHESKLIVNEKRPFIENLDLVPQPDLDLLRVTWNRRHRAVMTTSRGCPYKCRFCASSTFWDKTRLFSAEYVVSEMKNLIEKYDVREILLFDDFFAIDKKRVAKIVELKRMEPRLSKVSFECLSRVDSFSEDLAKLLKELGVNRISFGIESGCQKSLDYLKNKKISLSQVENTIRIAQKYGFQCVGSFVIGSPYECEADIRETFAFIEKLKLSSAQITIATPFPGTGLWEDGKKIGKIRDDQWSDDYYVLFGMDATVNFRELLKGKTLLTQIEPEVFYGLLEEAKMLLNKINITFKQRMRKIIRNTIITLGLSFVLHNKKRSQ